LHYVQSVDADITYLYLTIEDKSYRIRWEDCSPGLAKANLSQRQRMDIAPSGYGIHWPEIDEDLAITPLLRYAEKLEMESEENAVMHSARA
jgi:hypothetical protein